MNTQISTPISTPVPAVSTSTPLEQQLQQAIASAGTFKEYSSELPITPIAGYRVVKCLYRAASKGATAKTSMYCQIPEHIGQESVLEGFDELFPYVKELLEGIEDAAIKAEHSAGSTAIYGDKYNMQYLLELLEGQATTARLSGASIKEWADTAGANTADSQLCFSAYIYSLVAAKMGVSTADTNTSSLPTISAEQETRAALVVEGYVNKLATLASPKTIFAAQDQAQLIKVLEDSGLCAAGGIGARLLKRIQGMAEKEVGLMDL